MPSTYEPIATTTLTTAAASISFTGIPQTYTDLVIVSHVRGASSHHLYARWGNSAYDSGTNYSAVGLWTRTTSNSTGCERGGDENYARLTPFTYGVPSNTSVFGTVVTHIQNYSNTTTFKSAIARTGSVGSSSYAGSEIAAFLWRSTSAINQIQFTIGNGANFTTDTTITIYGIKAA
jgi:hypothetical protein